MNKIQVDLHMHSIYSDGTFFPEEILKLAIEKDLKFFSITDHNCVGFNIKNPRFIPGIEISVEDEIKEHKIEGLEVLGYGFDIKKMKEKIEPLRKSKIDSILKCVENFNEFNFNSNLFTPKNLKKITIKDFFEFRCKRRLSKEEFENLMKNSAPTKIDFAEFLYTTFFEFSDDLQKIYGDLPFLFKKEFSNTIFKTPKFKKLTFEEAISVIKECGGAAVLAHPAICRTLSRKWFGETEGLDPFEFIKILKEKYGLEGIEIYNYVGIIRYSKYSANLINNYFKEISKKLNLLNTWGSDWHGNKWWGSKFGSFGTNVEDIKNFLKKLNINLYK